MDKMIGRVFERLTVRSETPPPKEKSYAKNVGKWYRCECICGKFVTVPAMSLLNHSTKSCGCLRKEHGKFIIQHNRMSMIHNGNTTTPVTKVVNLEFEGVTKSMSAWAKDIGITKQALSKRLEKYPVEKALTMKGRKTNGN